MSAHEYLCIPPEPVLRASLYRSAKPSTCVAVMAHPSVDYLDHPLLPALAGQGINAVGMNTRYVGNDSRLIMEDCVLDIGRAITFLREERHFDQVALIGKSGGGGLAGLYQSQAEQPTLTQTPAGDPVALAERDLPRAQAIVALMAHPGRAAVYTECLDPAIRVETNPFDRDSELDLFNGVHGPPYDRDFLCRYRAAQHERSARIRSWVLDALAHLPVPDLPFVVHGTAADPRFVDLTIEPTDRQPGSIWGNPDLANLSPASLGHYTTLKSWLSQWSEADSNCHLGQFKHVTVPLAVLYGTADQIAFPSHAKAIYDSVGHDDRELIELRGANHYFRGQPELLADAVRHIARWLHGVGVMH